MIDILSGRFAENMTRFGSKMGQLIKSCVVCRKELASHNLAHISDKWALRKTEISDGLFSSIQVHSPIAMDVQLEVPSL